MSFGYFVHPRADRDLDEIGDYLTEKAGLDTGLQFLADSYAAFALLASNREIGWPCRIRHPHLVGVRRGLGASLRHCASGTFPTQLKWRLRIRGALVYHLFTPSGRRYPVALPLVPAL